MLNIIEYVDDQDHSFWKILENKPYNFLPLLQYFDDTLQLYLYYYTLTQEQQSFQVHCIAHM